MALCVTTHQDIAEADPAEWDSLLQPDDLQATHRFVRLCQDAEIGDSVYRHLLFHAGGRLVATATLCRLVVDLEVLASPALRLCIRALRGARRGFLRVPVVLCGLPVSFGQSCLRFGPQADRAVVLQALTGAMAEMAQDHGCGFLCLKEFADEECEGFGTLQDVGYLRLPSLPSCRLRLHAASFEAFLGSMRSGYRRQARADAETLARRGIALRRCADLAGTAATLHRFYLTVLDRAEFKVERIPRTFFDLLGGRLGTEASALLLEREGQPIASATVLEAGGKLTFLLSGLDETVADVAEMHRLIVCAVLNEAIRRGTPVVELGQTAYGPKMRYGAELSPRRLYLRHRSALLHNLLRGAAPLLFPERCWPARQVFRDR